MTLSNLNYEYATFAEARRRLVTPALFANKHQQAEEVSHRSKQVTQGNACGSSSDFLEQAQAQMEKLEKTNLPEHNFLSTISHELRTPLTSIKMCICLLESYLNRGNVLFSKNTKLNVIDSKIAQYIQVLKDECEREISLVNELLELQQLEVGFGPLVLEAIHLQHWLYQQVKPFQKRANNWGQILQVDITPELPPLISEPSSVERILAELLNNACKYTPPQEFITVTARLESEMILLNVSNSGVEISANELPHIFEPFYRIPQADRWKQGGAGLGLTVVRKLVERLAGSIQVESLEARTCFTVKLPQTLQTLAGINNKIIPPSLPSFLRGKG